MDIKPFSDDVSLNGPGVPRATQIDNLLRLLATIRHRFGNTAVEWSLSWGGSALWLRSNMKEEIERLQAIVEKLPKTADGVVVVPGMEVWRVWDATEYVPRWVSQLHGPFPTSLETIDDCNLSRHPVANCYSTRKAAEAAIEQEQTENTEDE